METEPRPERPLLKPDSLGPYQRVIGGACLLVVGLGLVAFVSKVLDLSAGSLLAIIFLSPLLTYLILTGQLAELSGGGFSAKFHDAARKRVEPSVRPITVEATQAVEKLGYEDAARILALRRDQTVVLTLVLGAPRGKYEPDPLRHYLDMLSDHPRFKFFVLLDSEERAVGYLPAEEVVFMLRTDETSKPLIDAVNAGRLPDVAALRDQFLSSETAVGVALQRMTDLSASAMPVRDTDGKLVGIVEREDVLARFLLDATRGY